MEQLQYHWIVKEEEEEEEDQQQDAALQRRQSLQHEEEQPTQQVEETSNVAESENKINDDSEASGLVVIAEFVESVIVTEEATSSTSAASQNIDSVYFDKQQGSDIQVENPELSPSHNASEIQAETVEKSGDESSAKAYSNMEEEIDQQLKEFDVEVVLAKQETHDLFCPNCKSCITKRVILRKRKRNITNLDTKAKRDKSATEVDNAIAAPDVSRVEPPVDDYEPEREPEVFKCLSCFSFFIPMKNGLKLFPSFGGTRKPEISQKPSAIPSSNVEDPSIVVAASNPNWFLALFTSKKGRKASAQDIVADISKPESGLVATVATTEILFNAGSPVLEKSQEDVNKTLEIAQDSYSSSMEKAQSPDQSYDSAVVASEVASDKQSFIVDATIPSFQDIKKVQKDIEEEISPSVAKEKKEAFESLTSQIADDVPIEGDTVTEAHTQIDIGEQPRAEVGEHQEWEILKSIVYGGLIESITSLGVVSSAAASGTAPLSILALGLANLIGGLFVIGHNLIDLKNNHSGGDSQQTNVQNRYQEVLGRKEHFLLHAAVVVISFVIFGSVPLVIYGLLISKNFYAEVKIAVVAAASVACIILLAIGKVYTTRAPKSYVKTVLNYVTLALATTGMSYIAGDLVKDLLEKISGSESGYVLTMMPSSDTTRMKPEWMSY